MQCFHTLPFYQKGNLTNKSTYVQLINYLVELRRDVLSFAGQAIIIAVCLWWENPDLEEPEVTLVEVSTLGREQLNFWGSFLRRSFIFCSTVALVYAAVYSCTREGLAACQSCCGSIVVGDRGPKRVADFNNRENTISHLARVFFITSIFSFSSKQFQLNTVRYRV